MVEGEAWAGPPQASASSADTAHRRGAQLWSVTRLDHSYCKQLSSSTLPPSGAWVGRGGSLEGAPGPSSCGI